MNAPLTFEDSVKIRLKGIVAELIPEDRFDAIVQHSVKEFETKTLPDLVKQELSEQYKAAIRSEFAKPEWQSQWNGVVYGASPALSKLLVDAAPVMLANMFSIASQQMLYDFQTKMQNLRY